MSCRHSAIFAVGFAVSLAACSTPYTEMGLFGGVSATQIDATTMRINARGNGFTDKTKVEDYVLLRAAEETLRHGYSAFQILSHEDTSRSGTYSIPETHYEPTIATGITPSGEPVTVMGGTSYTTESVNSYYKPGDSIVIRMFNGLGPKALSPNVYIADDVVSHLGPEIEKGDYVKPAVTSVANASAPSLPMPVAAHGVETPISESPPSLPACSADQL